MKAVIYARVSTDKQTVDNQLYHLQEWVKQRGYDLIEVYQESDTAWKAGHQPELSRLITNAYQRKFDIVVIWALDRVSREGAPATMEFYNKMLRYGIRLLSYQEPWTDMPMEFTPVMLAFTGCMAKMESDRRSARTKAGIERKRRDNGGRWGRPKGSQDKTKRQRRAKK